RWCNSVVWVVEVSARLRSLISMWLASYAISSPWQTTDKTADSDADMLFLVVDELPFNRRLLADQLGSLGYQCNTANDGVDALNVLSKTAIDIVLSDGNFPNMDGYRLTQLIRPPGLRQPVVGLPATALGASTQQLRGVGHAGGV
ncbi:response regulator, partial [Salmonella enterica]|uniref:response regulator n=1 Tax=Salmonella enterica TaxID=28901 RepID=UPI00398C39BC